MHYFCDPVKLTYYRDQIRYIAQNISVDRSVLKRSKELGEPRTCG